MLTCRLLGSFLILRDSITVFFSPLVLKFPSLSLHQRVTVLRKESIFHVKCIFTERPINLAL